MFTLCLQQPFECVVVITEERVDDRNLVCGYPVLSALGNQLIEDRACLVKLSNRRQHVRAFSVRCWSIARKTPLLFIRRQRFTVHSFSLKGPPQHGMSSH